MTMTTDNAPANAPHDPLERHLELKCARCSSVVHLHERRSAEGSWVPPSADALAALGWTRSATLPGKRELVLLADGTKAWADRPNEVVALPDWACGNQCARELVENIARYSGEFAVDGGSARGAALLQSMAVPDKPYQPREVTLRCGRSGCGAGVTLAVSHSSGPAMARALDAHGWVLSSAGKPFCSKRCGILRGMADSASAPTPVLRLPDVTVAARLDATRTPPAAPATVTHGKRAR
jgi:hypothetical protein